MKALIAILVVALALVAVPASAASTKILTMAPDGSFVILMRAPGETWELQQPACLYRKKKQWACGRVVGYDATRVKLRFFDPVKPVKVGSKIDLRRDDRAIASAAASETSAYRNPGQKLDVSLGMHIGFNYFYPVAHLQYAVTPKLAIGVMPMFSSFCQTPAGATPASNAQACFSHVGAFVTGNYYFTQEGMYRGFYGQLGLGFLKTSVEARLSGTPVAGGTTDYTAVSVLGTANYRGHAFNLGSIAFDGGVGLGFQYITGTPKDPTTGNSGVNFDGLLPVFNFFVATTF